MVDENNLIEGAKLSKNIRELEDQRNYYLQKIAQDSTLLQNLKNEAFLERFARENYLMKRPGEAIFIIQE